MNRGKLRRKKEKVNSVTLQQKLQQLMMFFFVPVIGAVLLIFSAILEYGNK